LHCEIELNIGIKPEELQRTELSEWQNGGLRRPHPQDFHFRPLIGLFCHPPL
jgi:hypothetical protein